MKLTIFAMILAVEFASVAHADGWKDDPVWHDGLVEMAVYSSSRVIYGKPRQYEAVFFTNKEQHDRATLTKAAKSTDTIEVWKHNQIESVATPNYTYHFVTTSHLTANDLRFTRLDSSSQEFCGTSFRQYMLRIGDDKLSFMLFSYMPEAGRVDGKITLEDRQVIPIDSLPLKLRDFDFAGKQTMKFWMLESQKTNRQSDPSVNPAEARFAAEEPDAFQIVVFKDTQLLGTYWMAKDRLHLMTRYESSDRSQKYDLKSVTRVNYWTIRGE
jgi:hypothetical protein